MKAADLSPEERRVTVAVSGHIPDSTSPLPAASAVQEQPSATSSSLSSSSSNPTMLAAVHSLSMPTSLGMRAQQRSLEPRSLHHQSAPAEPMLAYVNRPVIVTGTNCRVMPPAPISVINGHLHQPRSPSNEPQYMHGGSMDAYGSGSSAFVRQLEMPAPPRLPVPPPETCIQSNTVSYTPHSPPSCVPDSNSVVDPEQEIRKTIETYCSSGDRTGKEIPVKQLRHVIPLLILHCYGNRGDPSQKKVKGLWDRAPSDWPDDVPYLDPNNAQKSKGENCKPKKETLMKMFTFLQRKYMISQNKVEHEECKSKVMPYPVEESQGPCVSSSSSTRTPCAMPSMLPTDTPSTSVPLALVTSSSSQQPRRPSAPGPDSSHIRHPYNHHPYQRQPSPPQQPSPPVAPAVVPPLVAPQPCQPLSLKQEPTTSPTPSSPRGTCSPPNRPQTLKERILGPKQPESPPEPVLMEVQEPVSLVMTSAEEEAEGSWDPLHEINTRIDKKLIYLEKVYGKDGKIGLLQINRDLLQKFPLVLNEIDPQQQHTYVEMMHEFECSLDILKKFRILPESHRTRWEEFEDKWYVKVVGLCNQRQPSPDHVPSR